MEERYCPECGRDVLTERSHSPYSRTAAGVRRDAEATITDLRAKAGELTSWEVAGIELLSRTDVLALFPEKEKP